MNKLQLLPVVLALALASNVFAADSSPVQGGSETGIEGVISAGPVHGGPTRPGVPDTRPLANVPFNVENEGRIITSFTTDDQGHFRISLSPGHYSISMKDRKPRLGQCGPFAVDVTAGQVKKLDWICDTGMR